jgi:hypothetical protein
MVDGKIFIREPWAREIVQGRKSIETAHIRLPERFWGRLLHVQNENREVVGEVRFKGGWIQYHASDAFNADFFKHRINLDSKYHFDNRRRCFGWTIDEVRPYDVPLRGVGFKSQFRLEFY